MSRDFDAARRAPVTSAGAPASSNSLAETREASGSLLAEMTPGSGAFAAVATERAGQLIGRYRLLEPLGQGGFGVVWRAEQLEGVKRHVALKIIKLGMDTRQVIARFEAERQALALMDHPHIAKVLDAGATETGRPYFVMELVDGRPITQYADEVSLTIRVRLALFEQVCDAVQHAHQKGVIHRDIKPSNVLVATRDGRPQVRVIDFGIAKATSQRLTDSTVQTELRQFMGTPAYMSPEQAAGSADIDTRTDVYSLGVLLYELLVGSTPFELGAIRGAGFAELQRVICEVDPPNPSTRLAQRTEAQFEIASRRGIDIGRLRLMVRGDLNWIVMKALEKDRTRRYSSAAEFGADLQRYLTGEPVVAAPPSGAYRLRKFVRRHRGSALAAGVVALTLVLGVIGVSLSLLQARLDRDRAVAAEREQRRLREVAEDSRAREAASRRRAETSRAEAAAVSEFLVDMLRSPDPRASGRDVRVADVLRDAARKLDGAFPDTPEVEATLRVALVKTFSDLSLFDEAEAQLAAAVPLVTQLYGETGATTLGLRNAQSTILSARGRNEEAVELLRCAVEYAATERPPEDTQLLSLRTALANQLRECGDYAQAEQILRDLLAIHERLPFEQPRDRLIVMNSLGVLLQSQKRLGEAESLYRETARLATEQFGAGHPEVITPQANLAVLHRQLGRLDESAALQIELLEQMKAVFGENHRNVATGYANLAELEESRGRYRDALRYWEAALAMRRLVEGERSLNVASVLVGVARTRMQLGDLPAAEANLRLGVELIRELGGARAATISAETDLANLLAKLGRSAEAEALFRSLIETVPLEFGTDSRENIIAHNSIAVLLQGEGRLDEAEGHYRMAAELGERVLGPNNRDQLITEHNLMGVIRERGDAVGAAEVGRRLIARAVEVFGPDHPTTAHMRSSVGLTLRMAGALDEAGAMLEASAKLRREMLGPRHPDLASTLLELALVRIEQGDPAAAEPLAREAFEIRAAAYPEGHRFAWRQHAAASVLGAALIGLDRFEEAEQVLTDAYAGLEANLDKLPADARAKRRVETAGRLLKLYERWGGSAPDTAIVEKAEQWRARLEGVLSEGGSTP